MPADRASSTRQFDILSAYAEPFVTGRRVVVIAEAAAELGARLVEMGARSVHAYEIGPVAVVRTYRGVVSRPLPAGELDARDAAFDLAVIPDASALDVADREALLGRVRRLVGASGAVLVGASGHASAAAPLDYYELFDLVSADFGNVQMIGQVPFAGVALAALGDDEEPEVTVDTQLAGDAAPPEWFFALGSEVPLSTRPYVILQLPEPEEPLVDTDRGAERTTDAAELVAARLRAEVLESQLEQQRHRTQEAAEAKEALRRVEQIARDREEQARALAEALTAAETTAQVLAARLQQAEVTATGSDARIAIIVARNEELERTQVDPNALRDTIARAEQAAALAILLEAQLVEMADAHAAEVSALEESLRERGRAVQALEREVHKRDAIVKELLVRLDVATSTSTSTSTSASTSTSDDVPRLKANLEALAIEVARREGELQAAKWRIEELELKNASSPALPAVADQDADRLRDEIEMLRQALRQEHDARVRAENLSGKGEASA